MSIPKDNPPISAKTLSSVAPSVLIEIILRQQAAVETLQTEVSRLKAQLGTDSKTTLKPPSSDLLKKSEKPGKRPSSHQLAWLPAKPTEMVAYAQHHCQCACGAVVSGQCPRDGVPTQDLSIGIQSLLGWLGNYGHLFCGKQQEFLKELGDIEIGLGTLRSTNERAANAVVQPVDRLWRWTRSQAPVQVDEIPWIGQDVKEWLRVAGAEMFCLFHAAGTRSRGELKAMLGRSFDGVLGSDDFSAYISAYNGYDVTAQQKCLTHLRRHFKRLALKAIGDKQKMAKAFLKRIDKAFCHHRQWRETQDERAYYDWAGKFRKRLVAALKRWTDKVDGITQTLLSSLKEKTKQGCMSLSATGSFYFCLLSTGPSGSTSSVNGSTFLDFSGYDLNTTFF